MFELRPWTGDDLALLERLMGDPAMTEHIGGPESPERIRNRLERYCLCSNEENGWMFVIVAGPERSPAGSVGYWPRHWKGELVWETGWSVLPEFQGQGLATLATAAAIARARDKNTLRFVHAFPSVKNPSSNAICRKLGFTLQGEVEFEYPPGNFMLCSDWRLDLHDESNVGDVGI